MIPAFCPNDAPPGEKAVYAALRDSPETKHWIVLHSLAIADHIRQVEGEADFVVVVPQHGILVIEVKSHQFIDRGPDGIWRLGNDSPTTRGPFRQVTEAMYSLRSHLLQKNVDLRGVPLLSAVWFTSVRARTMLPRTPEWHDWQVLDSEDLKNAPTSILRTIDSGSAHLNEKVPHFSYGGQGPELETAKRIVKLLRPTFELVTVPGDRRRARNSELDSFIEEQFLALDAAADNRAVMFTGPAGSGKTLLAMESAHREISTGKHGRLLCFNRLLGKTLTKTVGGLEGLEVNTFHKELLRIANIDHIPAGATSSFWNEELPERALETMLGDCDIEPSDFLIIDEMQDITSDAYLDVLDIMVIGGLENGRLLLFGDFERQAIFEDRNRLDKLRARSPHLATHRLIRNCRNLPRIGYQVNLLSNLQPGYRSFRRQDDGIDPTFYKYASCEDQSALLTQAIRALREEGYELSEITILSPLSSTSTASTTTDPWLRQILRPADGESHRPGRVAYSTIHAFKGLESPAIVVTDLDRSRTHDNFESLLYVGLTRATDRLFALIEENTFRQLVGGAA